MVRRGETRWWSSAFAATRRKCARIWMSNDRATYVDEFNAVYPGTKVPTSAVRCGASSRQCVSPGVTSCIRHEIISSANLIPSVNLRQLNGPFWTLPSYPSRFRWGIGVPKENDRGLPEVTDPVAATSSNAAVFPRLSRLRNETFNVLERLSTACYQNQQSESGGPADLGARFSRSARAYLIAPFLKAVHIARPLQLFPCFVLSRGCPSLTFSAETQQCFRVASAAVHNESYNVVQEVGLVWRVSFYQHPCPWSFPPTYGTRKSWVCMLTTMLTEARQSVSECGSCLA